MGKSNGPLLFAGNITEVVASIDALCKQNPEVKDSLEKEASYFEKHADLMRYKVFREKGYQIGSGVIESACKHVVGRRCKQAAMRWKKKVSTSAFRTMFDKKWGVGQILE